MPWKLNLGVTTASHIRLIAYVSTYTEMQSKLKRHVLSTKYFIRCDQPGSITGVQPGRGANFGSWFTCCQQVLRCVVTCSSHTYNHTQGATGNSWDCLLSLIASCSHFILPTPPVRIIAVYFPWISKNIIHPGNKGFHAVRHASEVTCSIS